MTPTEYEEEKKFVLSELADKDTQKKGLGADYIKDLIKPFTDDKEVMFACMPNHTGSTEFASPRLFADREFVMSVVRRQGSYLQFASTALKDDLYVVQQACEQNAHSFKHASFRIRNDTYSIANCCNTSFQVLDYMDKSVSRDKEKVLSLIDNVFSSRLELSKYGKEIALKHIMNRTNKNIKSLVGDGDPVEILTKAIASEKLSNRLSEQLKPKIELRETMKMKI